MDINVLILAAGSQRIENSDFAYPLCLTELDGKSMLEITIDASKNIKNANFSFAFLKDDIVKFNLDNVASHLIPKSQTIQIEKGTKGSGASALNAACRFDEEKELLILSANELLKIDYESEVSKFRKNCLDGGTLIFKSIHPRYSYVRVNKDMLVLEASQQKQISTSATTGFFWFKKTKYFTESFQKIVLKNLAVDGLFYIAPTFNEMILDGLTVGANKIDNNQYLPVKDKTQQLQLNEDSIYEK